MAKSKKTNKRSFWQQLFAGFLAGALISSFFGGSASAHVNDYSVSGMDGIITITDRNGDMMIVPADCARVIADNSTDFTELHTNRATSLPEYVEACF